MRFTTDQLERRRRLYRQRLYRPSRHHVSSKRYRKPRKQAAPLYPGGVIDLDRAYWGVDLHASDQRSVGGTPLLLVAGLEYDDLAEARKGYLNYIGDQLGVEGALRRDEANYVYDFDQYFQAQWDPAARWRLIAGVRNSLVEVTSHGHIPVLDGADSEVRYSAVNPVAGVTFRATSAINIYGAYGKGFETPTLNDLAYRSVDGSLPGLNLGLKPARSDNYEAGIKAGNDTVRANLAAFYIKTTDELAVLQNSAGRTVDQNIGETTRRGLELDVQGKLARRVQRPAGLHLHQRRGRATLFHLRRGALQPTGESWCAAAGELPLRGCRKFPTRSCAKCPLRGADLELCTAGLLDHAGGSGSRGDLCE